MILLCAGEVSDKSFDGLIQLAHLLSDLGFVVGIDAMYLPQERPRNQQYEAALFLCEANETDPGHVLLIGAEHTSDEVLQWLRTVGFSLDGKLCAIGRFADYQHQLTAQNRLAFAIGQEPRMIAFQADQELSVFGGSGLGPLFTQIRRRLRSEVHALKNLMVYVPPESLEDPATFSQLAALSYASKDCDVHVLTNGHGKMLVRNSQYSNLSVFGYSDLPPRALLAYADIVAFFGENIPGARMAQFALDTMGAGGVVIDCTEKSKFHAAGAPVLSGPKDIIALTAYVENVVLPQFPEIARRTGASSWLASFDVRNLINELELPEPGRETGHQNSTVFFPTNGNGLGHAKRCSLVAEKLGEQKPVQFAAFPSCIGLLKGGGFDVLPMVQKSLELVEEHANDLLNYRRLNALLKTGDRLVFDGGYIFDSIYRVVASKNLPATWIRRGLWRPEHVSANALEREHIFDQIIVPLEAFDELNESYTFGSKVRQVGPIVEQVTPIDRLKLRADLTEKFDRPFERFVVSMLGGGVASDRNAQLQMMCGLMEKEDQVLHLIVSWPGAVIAPNLFGWKNSIVVQTQNALQLAHSADLVVSAAGYNSFHELIYAEIPTIFIPQSAPFLDDQERRARAAEERDLAVLVKDNEMLKLKTAVHEILSGDLGQSLRSALRANNLPEPGNQAAADIIFGGVRS